MQQFDFADPDMANSKRTTPIVPQQAVLHEQPDERGRGAEGHVATRVFSRHGWTRASRAIYQVLFSEPPPERCASRRVYKRK